MIGGMSGEFETRLISLRKAGAVVINGTVIEGAREGAQVHEEGTLVDAAGQKKAQEDTIGGPKALRKEEALIP